MSMSSMVAKWAAFYEQECGHGPSEPALRIAEHIQKVGKTLTELGKKDAKKREKPYSADAFRELAAKAFRLDPDKNYKTVRAVADVWMSDYLRGYKGEETK